ncbi:MAG TPA: HAMP domain-containing sensor histidine kinase [Bacteroidota bacterium]|nr:HAMP domain-containing sensor histidine kinase [Bacteroidota bacterium]
MGSTSLSATTLARLRGEELSYISDALRTPLTSIVGFADAILSDPALAKDQKEEFIKIIKAEGERLSKFVDELLYTAVATRELPSMDHWELPAVIASAFHNVSLPAATRSIALRHDVPQTFPRLFLEKEFTTRMLDNILINAVRYAPNNSEILVHADISGSDLVLQIHAPRAGQSFAGNDASQLGLARTEYLAGLYGGSLHIDQPQDHETVITLSLPLGS